MNPILKVINAVLKTKFGEEEVPPYPKDFALIDYSPIAKQNGIKDEQNKLIYRYFYDGFGNVVMKKYRYSKARVKSLQEVHKIPIFDKTKEEERFPVFHKVLPSEIEYTITK